MPPFIVLNGCSHVEFPEKNLLPPAGLPTHAFIPSAMFPCAHLLASLPPPFLVNFVM